MKPPFRPLDVPSRWMVDSGKLVETSNIHTLGELRLGTYALLGDPSWTDSRVVARVSTEDDDIGVMFRYIDANNYYRFSINWQIPFRRLVRFAGGEPHLLREVAVGYDRNRDYLITVDAFGDRLQVYVDGARVFDERDATHSTGRVGLHCWSNNGFRASRVEVGNWGLFHQFTRERVQPDGTVVRVHSGAPDGTPSPPKRESWARRGCGTTAHACASPIETTASSAP
jgi:hypothetical protein